MINATILLVLVATVIPYQFAYMVACLVQLSTCARALWYFKETVCILFFLFVGVWFLTIAASGR